MPYIEENLREYLQQPIDLIANRVGTFSDKSKPGLLNYVITKILMLSYDPNSYFDYNQITGILGNVDKEIYRRKTAIYEDKKMEENGDVF